MTAGTIVLDGVGEPTGAAAGSMARAIYDAYASTIDLDIDDGTHTGANGVPTLTDSSKSWAVDEHVNRYVINLTDGSSGQITANDATTITATLSGGTGNVWDTGDAYVICNADAAGRKAARQGIVDLCNALASGVVTHIAANAQAKITTSDAGLQRLPAAPMSEDDPCKAPASTKYLDIE